MAVGVVAYLAELVVATSPVRARTESAPGRVSVPTSPRPLEGEVTVPDQNREAQNREPQ